MSAFDLYSPSHRVGDLLLCSLETYQQQIAPLPFCRFLFMQSSCYWPISPDVIIRKIWNSPNWWAISLYVFIYITLCCVLCREVHILCDAALIYANQIAHQHGERGISRRVWRACKGSIVYYPVIWHKFFIRWQRLLRQFQYFPPEWFACGFFPFFRNHWVFNASYTSVYKGKNQIIFIFYWAFFLFFIWITLFF